MVETCIPHAAPLHSHGRSMKTTKEDMIGLVKAVEIYQELDHDIITQQWEAEAASVVAAVAAIDGIDGAPGYARYSDGIPVAQLLIEPRILGRDAADLAAALAAGEPSIRVAQDRQNLTINPQFLQTGEMDAVSARLLELLTA